MATSRCFGFACSRFDQGWRLVFSHVILAQQFLKVTAHQWILAFFDQIGNSSGSWCRGLLFFLQQLRNFNRGFPSTWQHQLCFSSIFIFMFIFNIFLVLFNILWCVFLFFFLTIFRLVVSQWRLLQKFWQLINNCVSLRFLGRPRLIGFILFRRVRPCGNAISDLISLHCIGISSFLQMGHIIFIKGLIWVQFCVDNFLYFLGTVGPYTVLIKCIHL